MRTANDNDASRSSSASADTIAMRAYVQLTEENCLRAGLDPKDFLRVFCGELERRGFRDMADIEAALGYLQTRTADDHAQTMPYDEDAHVE